MANKKMLNELIMLNNELITKYYNEKNQEQFEKHNLIGKILSDSSAFDKIDIAVALNIIIDITGDDKNAFEIYKQVMLTNID